jgi:hypothetical protein
MLLRSDLTIFKLFIVTGDSLTLCCKLYFRGEEVVGYLEDVYLLQELVQVLLDISKNNYAENYA